MSWAFRPPCDFSRVKILTHACDGAGDLGAELGEVDVQHWPVGDGHAALGGGQVQAGVHLRLAQVYLTRPTEQQVSKQGDRKEEENTETKPIYLLTVYTELVPRRQQFHMALAM